VADALAVPVEDVVMVEAVLGQRDVAIGPVDDGVGFEIADGGLSPEDQAANRQSEDLARAQVKDALSRLGERERAIVTRRMLDDDVATLAMLGQDMGLSRERIRQIEKRAQEKLRSALLAQVA
jgi:RNA polymerase sigma-32 factor